MVHSFPHWEIGQGITDTYLVEYKRNKHEIIDQSTYPYEMAVPQVALEELATILGVVEIDLADHA